MTTTRDIAEAVACGLPVTDFCVFRNMRALAERTPLPATLLLALALVEDVGQINAFISA